MDNVTSRGAQALLELFAISQELPMHVHSRPARMEDVSKRHV